jgi:hypothetical protein
LIGHIDGTARKPTPYLSINGVIMRDKDNIATDDEIDAKERKFEEYEQKEYMAQHVILSTISLRLSSTVKSKSNAKEMWDAVKLDATSKSKMHQVDTRRRLQQIQCDEDGDVRTHLIEMVKLRDELTAMGCSIDEAEFTTIILGSLPVSYRTLLTTITVSAGLSGRTVDSNEIWRICLTRWRRQS